MNDDPSPEYAAFADAARRLRDAELALREAQAHYRAALDALNRAVAPLPASATP